MSLRAAVRADAAANIEREPGALRRRDVLSECVTSRGVQALVLHRMAHAAGCRRWTPLAEVLLRISQLVYGVDIAWQASLAPGVTLRHAMGVVVGREVVIGSRSVLFQNVTLGKRLSGSADRPDGMPVVGRNVLIAAGACVLGPVTIGDGAVIGANAVVVADVPAGALAAGNPARISLPV